MGNIRGVHRRVQHRGREVTSPSLRVVRTVEKNQPELEKKLERIQHALGGRACIETIDKMSLTLFESRDALPRIKRAGESTDPDNLQRIAQEIADRMHTFMYGDETFALQYKPIDLFGRRDSRYLVFLLNGNMRLEAERAAIEAFFNDNYGTECNTKLKTTTFLPHVTFGRVHGNPKNFKKDPIDNLLTAARKSSNGDKNPKLRDLIPQTITLNGLAIMVNERFMA